VTLLQDAGVPTLEPADLAAARDALRDAPGALLLRGAGTKAAWGAPPERVDAVVSTRRLDALVDHSAGDMIAVVGAGLPLARLQGALAGDGQWLAVDPPRSGDGATIGGVFATDDAGPRRQRYGSLRDLVIGVTVVLADGTVGRGGGRVVKNVAGFDLMRLLCGALGTLGLVTELVVRLHPLPEASTTVRVPADATRAARLGAATLRDLAPVVSALEWGHGALWVRVEGRERAVRAGVERVLRLAAAHDGGRAEALTGEDEDRAWQALTAVAAGGPRVTTARAATLADRLPAVAAALTEAAAAGGVAAELVCAAGLGLHTAALSGGDAAAHARTVAHWRRSVTALGGTVVLRDRVDGVDALVDAWLDPDAPAPSALELMRRVKQSLDPERRLAPGRFLGGL
jgi:glycolate oxidase FAD binding subunit